MSDFVSLTCPSCGAKLQITNDLEHFACGNCGNEYVVNRNGGVISVKPIIEKLRDVQTGVDKTASELAIKRLTGEINQLQQRINSIESPELLGVIASGFLIFGVLGMCGSVTQLSRGKPSAIGFMILLLAIGGGLFYLVENWGSDEKRRYYKEIHSLEEELERHVKIVKMN